jgi:tellurite resistance protein TerC
MNEVYVWIGFIILVLILMAVDLGVFNKKAHTPTMKEALLSTIGWVFLALCFNGFIYFAYQHQWLGLGVHDGVRIDGNEAALEFLTAYLLEESLSIDNLFVMAIVFAQFRVPKRFQHRILFWGILGVLVFRGLLIGVGIWLISYFEWLFYFFGALLLWTAYKMLKDKDAEPDVSNHSVVRFIRRVYPVSDTYDGDNFFTIQNGRKAATPMFVALMVIETTDIMFAFDSVPAVFSVTQDPFLVFTSNIFAILGLRSLYFVLSNILDRFEYLRYSLMAILSYIGIKMILLPLGVHLPTAISLLIIGALLVAGVIASLLLSEPRDGPDKKT